MKKLKVIPLFLTIFLTGCSHYYYVESMQNVPLFREKNELHFNGAYSGGDESECIEAQTAYSFSHNIGFMAGFMHASGGDSPNDNYGKGYYLDGAVGYFKPFGKYVVFEIYGGLGASNQHQVYKGLQWDNSSGKYITTDEGTADLTFVKSYIQPSIGFTSGILNIAVSTRIGNVKYTSVNNYIFNNIYEYNEVASLAGTNHLFLEPAFTLQAGLKNLKFLGQVSYSYDATNPGMNIGEDWHLSLGISYVIADRFKKDLSSSPKP